MLIWHRDNNLFDECFFFSIIKSGRYMKITSWERSKLWQIRFIYNFKNSPCMIKCVRLVVNVYNHALTFLILNCCLTYLIIAINTSKSIIYAYTQYNCIITLYAKRFYAIRTANVWQLKSISLPRVAGNILKTVLILL